MTTDAEIIEEAIETLFWGAFDGSHHKMWAIDQTLRVLTRCPLVDMINKSAVGGPHHFQGLGKSEQYIQLIKEYERDGEYEWDEGIAP